MSTVLKAYSFFNSFQISFIIGFLNHRSRRLAHCASTVYSPHASSSIRATLSLTVSVLHMYPIQLARGTPRPRPLHAPSPPFPLPHTRALAACATRFACCWYLLNTFIFVVLLMYFFFRCPPTPASAPLLCLAHLLRVVVAAADVDVVVDVSRWRFGGYSALCCATVRSVVARRWIQTRREIARRAAIRRERYTDGQKRKSKRIREQEEEEDETRRGRGRNTAKKTRACVLLPVIFVAEEESPSSSSAAGGGVCGTKSNWKVITPSEFLNSFA